MSRLTHWLRATLAAAPHATSEHLKGHLDVTLAAVRLHNPSLIKQVFAGDLIVEAVHLAADGYPKQAQERADEALRVLL